MNTELFESATFNQGWASHAASAVLSCGVKGCFFLLGAMVLVALMRRASASTRHFVWTLALGTLLLLPASMFIFPALPVPVLPMQSGKIETTMPATKPLPLATKTTPQVVALNSPALSVSAQSSIFSQSSPSARFPVETWSVFMWGLGALLFFIPLLVGTFIVRRSIHRATPFPESATMQAIVESAGVGRSVRVLCGGEGTMPFAAGILRPCILLPSEATEWPEEKLRAVLLHELAHVKRHDCLTHALAYVGVSLHWFNPLAWMALRRQRIERERACDDFVLVSGAKASVYADHLLHLAGTLHADPFSATAALPMAKKSQLEGRLLAILDAARNRRTLRWAGIIVGVLLVLAIAIPVGLLKFKEAQVFSQMTSEQKAEFQRWYTEKVVFPPDVLEVKEYAKETLDAVDEYQVLYEKHIDKINQLTQVWNAAQSKKKGDDIVLPTLTSESKLVLAEVGPFMAAYHKVAHQPDYDVEVWRPMPGRRNPNEGKTSVLGGDKYIRLRQAACLTQMQAVEAIERKDFRQAMEYADALVLSSRAHRYSTLIDRMIGCALLRLGERVWQRIALECGENAELRQLALEKINARHPEEYHLDFTIEVGGLWCSSDIMGGFRHLRRWGVEVDTRDKTGMLLQLEYLRGTMDLDAKHPYGNKKNSAPDLEAARRMQDMINAISGNVWWGRRLYHRWVDPISAAELYGVAIPGFEKAKAQVQQRLRGYDALKKEFAQDANVPTTATP